jgi:MarR family transcriptional regulator, lower aerobic nicotinate degradation pathway regulator
MTGRRDLLAMVQPLTKVLRRIEDEAAARQGLSMWQYAILSVVAEQPGLNQGEVAGILRYSANRIIADLDDLEQRRLVTRRPGADRRANVLSTTRSGLTVQGRVQREVHQREDELLACLRTDQRRQLYSALSILEQRVGATAQDG